VATDIRLDDDSSEQWVTVAARVLNVAGSDLLLDSPERRSGAGSRFRRALVHDSNDGLTINFGDDYPGGVRINDATLKLRCLHQGATPQLPKTGELGELLVTRNVTTVEGTVIGETCSLWLCVGRPEQRRRISGAASWLPLTTGSPVVGTI